jgi:hypothetical protein
MVYLQNHIPYGQRKSNHGISAKTYALRAKNIKPWYIYKTIFPMGKEYQTMVYLQDHMPYGQRISNHGISAKPYALRAKNF